MNLLGALGGVGAGINLGLAEVRRQGAEKREKEKFAFEKEKMEDERASRRRAKDVQATTDAEYARLGSDTFDAQPMDPELAGPPEMTKTGTVGLGDVKRNTADALAKKGYGKEAESAQREYDAYKAEGVDKAINAFKRGAGPDELTKIFNNHGENKIQGIDSIDYKTGEIAYRDTKGNKQTMNALDVERRMLSIKDATGLKKDESTVRKNDADASEKEAEVNAGLPSAKVKNYEANAVQSRAAANASNVSAATGSYALQQEKLADAALAVPAEKRTPEQNAALERRNSKNGSQDPADVKSVKWLMANVPSLKGDAKAAWDLHHAAKGKDAQQSMIDVKTKLIAADKMGDYKGPDGIKKLNEDAAAIIQGAAVTPSAPGLATVATPTAPAAAQQPTGPRKKSLDSF